MLKKNITSDINNYAVMLTTNYIEHDIMSVMSVNRLSNLHTHKYGKHKHNEKQKRTKISEYKRKLRIDLYNKM